MEQVYRENQVWKKKNIQQHIKYEIQGMMSSTYLRIVIKCRLKYRIFQPLSLWLSYFLSLLAVIVINFDFSRKCKYTQFLT